MNKPLRGQERTAPGAGEEEACRLLVAENLVYIENQCVRAVARRTGESGFSGGIEAENEALELNNAVLDILRRDHYRVLREFGGRAGVRTYLTAIIARQAVEMIRKKRGRRHDEEKVRRWGRTGMLLYQRVIRDNVPVEQVSREMAESGDNRHTLAELQDILANVRGALAGGRSPGSGGGVVYEGGVTGENEYIVPDTRGDPFSQALTLEREERIRDILHDILESLTGEERLLIRLRFPVREGDAPAPVEQIARVFSIQPKAVYKRLARLMEKCRSQLAGYGVNIDDIF